VVEEHDLVACIDEALYLEAVIRPHLLPPPRLLDDPGGAVEPLERRHHLDVLGERRQSRLVVPANVVVQHLPDDLEVPLPNGLRVPPRHVTSIQGPGVPEEVPGASRSEACPLDRLEAHVH
jgi:hypothetical protein